MPDAVVELTNEPGDPVRFVEAQIKHAFDSPAAEHAHEPRVSSITTPPDRAVISRPGIPFPNDSYGRFDQECAGPLRQRNGQSLIAGIVPDPKEIVVQRPATTPDCDSKEIVSEIELRAQAESPTATAGAKAAQAESGWRRIARTKRSHIENGRSNSVPYRRINQWDRRKGEFSTPVGLGVSLGFMLTHPCFRPSRRKA
jgi:hypothetical protein